MKGEQVRVLHFVEASGGGVLSVVSDSIRTLEREFPQRFQFTVLYSRRPETPENLQELLPGVELIEMVVGRHFFSLRDIGAAIKVASMSRRFDVMHCHSSRAGFIGRMARVLGGCRKVLYSPHCYAFLSNEFSKVKRTGVFIVESLLARLTGATTVACGDSELVYARRVGGRSVLIRNGFSPTDAQLERRTQRDAPVVVGVGRDSPQKDQPLFIRIAEQCRESLVRFLWVGPSASAIGSGWVSRMRSTELIRGADVFLMTSRWEGLPVSGLEAMAAGLPLVVRDVPGARDLVEHGKNGFLFRSEYEAIEYVRKLSSDKALRESMGSSSAEILRTKYSLDNYLGLAAIYTQ